LYGIIYKATGPDGRVYVGQTVKTLVQRKGHHKFMAIKGDKRTAFQIAILEFGGVNAFRWEQIDTAESREELDLKEKYWIAHYQSDNPQYGHNSTDRGIRCSHNAEVRQKISKANKGKKHGRKGEPLAAQHRKNISEAMMGKHRSPEVCQKISKSLKGHASWSKGKKHTIEARKKMSEARKGKNVGEKHHLAKLTEGQVTEIKTAIANGERVCNLARKYTISQALISQIKSGKRWQWLQV